MRRACRTASSPTAATPSASSDPARFRRRQPAERRKGPRRSRSLPRARRLPSGLEQRTNTQPIAPEAHAYTNDHYTKEAARIDGVLARRLEEAEQHAGADSIAYNET